MDESTDQIRQEIDRNRQGAADKIDQIQQQVQDTADQLRGNVQGTVEDTIETVKGTVDDTVQSVKAGVENFDLRQRIEERPLVALGAAFIGGFVLGGLMGDDDGHRQASTSYSGERYQSQPTQYASGGSMAQSIRSAMQKTGLEDTVSSAAAALMGSFTDQLKDTIDRNFPGFADRMQTAQNAPGGFAEKSRETQSTTI